MADSSTLSGGELNAAVTKALLQVQAEHLGREPENASTYHHDNVLVRLMHGVLNHAEKLLGTNGNHAEVLEMRNLYQQEMEPEFRAAVERQTGRKVIAFISANHVEPDIASEVFILDAPI
jgi:uncharacterized protein YbcI